MLTNPVKRCVGCTSAVSHKNLTIRDRHKIKMIKRQTRNHFIARGEESLPQPPYHSPSLVGNFGHSHPQKLQPPLPYPHLGEENIIDL
jgi:hypothetical protein